MRYKALFIDLDDTIWDFSTASHIAMRNTYDTFELFRYYPDFEEYFRIFSEKNKELWTLYNKACISKEELITERFDYLIRRVGIVNREIGSQLNTYYLDNLSQQGTLMESAYKSLTLLHQNYPLYIISNGFEEVQFKKMESAGISNLFSGIILSDHVGVNKPHINIFNTALKSAHVASHEAIMIGDNYDADIIGAANAGLDTIYYNPLNHSIKEYNPTYSVTHWDQILSIL